jgi:Tol biopolymer transport system component/DNA-binding winged helix-turn-helix (wHTH) protein
MSEVYAYEFGRFRIDLKARELTRDEQLIPIRPRLFDLLLLLVTKQGQVVTRDEIIEQIWEDAIIEDGNITQAIHFLRRIIEEQDLNESQILTIPKRGYVFTAEVRALNPELFTDPLAVTAPPVVPLRLSGKESHSQRYWQLRGGRIGVAVIVLASLLLLGSYIIFKSSIRSLTIHSHSTIPSHQLDPEFSPDGKFLAFSSFGETGDNEDIYIKTTDQAQRMRLTNNPDAESTPVWSPDGMRIAFLRWSRGDRLSARVIIADYKSGIEEEVGTSRGALGWMPDGKHLIVNDLAADGLATVLFLVSLDRRERRQLTSTVSAGTVDTMPRAARHRQIIAFLRTSGGSRGDIHLLDILSGQISQVTHEEKSISFFQWGLREAGFYLVSNRSGVPRLWHSALPGLISKIYGNDGKARLVDQVPYQLDQFTILPTPPILAYSRQLNQDQVRIIEITDREVKSPKCCLLTQASTDEAPQFAPNGTKVAFLSKQTGEDVIWMASPDCLEQVRLASFRGGTISHLRWSPDSSQLVFEQQVDGQAEIWTIETGGKPPVRLTHNNFDDKQPSWSADGRSIYYVGIVEGQETIRRIPTSGGEPMTIVSTGGREPVESVDGANLYFVREGLFFVKPLSVAGEDLSLQAERPIKDLQVGQNWQIRSEALSFVEDKSGASLVIEQVNFSTRRVERIVKIGGILASATSSISLSPNKCYLSVILKGGQIGELSIVEGWRLKPFSEYMIDILHLESLLNPNRWMRGVRGDN